MSVFLRLLVELSGSPQNFDAQSSSDGDQHQGGVFPAEAAERHGRNGVVYANLGT